MTAEEVLVNLINEFPDLLDESLEVTPDLPALDKKLRGLLREFLGEPTLPAEKNGQNGQNGHGVEPVKMRRVGQPRTAGKRVRDFLTKNPEQWLMFETISQKVEEEKQPGEPVLKTYQIYEGLYGLAGLRRRRWPKNKSFVEYGYFPQEVQLNPEQRRHGLAHKRTEK